MEEFEVEGLFMEDDEVRKIGTVQLEPTTPWQEMPEKLYIKGFTYTLQLI